jgi:hypothetical protein
MAGHRLRPTATTLTASHWQPAPWPRPMTLAKRRRPEGKDLGHRPLAVNRLGLGSYWSPTCTKRPHAPHRRIRRTCTHGQPGHDPVAGVARPRPSCQHARAAAALAGLVMGAIEELAVQDCHPRCRASTRTRLPSSCKKLAHDVVCPWTRTPSACKKPPRPWTAGRARQGNARSRQPVGCLSTDTRPRRRL